MENNEKSKEEYMESVKTTFEQLNQYNNILMTIGLGSFFAISSMIKDISNQKCFHLSVFFVFLATVIFVAHELFRMFYFSWYSTNLSRAIEALPDDNPLKSTNQFSLVASITFQKYNKWFLFPSLIFGTLGILMAFLNFVFILLK